MNINELVEQILTICPNADLNYDNEGQIIVYTNLMHSEEDFELIDFESD